MDLSASSISRFPGFDRLYLLAEGTLKAFRVNLELSTETAIQVTRGEYRQSPPIRATWFMGARVPTDIIWTGLAAPLLVNERVVELLNEHGFRGWDTYAVEVHGKRGEPIAGYRGFCVSGRCGPIDNARSVKSSKSFPGGTFPIWKGAYFDPQSWDGCEFFMPAGRVGWIFVVDAVKAAFERARLKNVAFERLEEIERGEVEMSVRLDR